MFLSFFNFSRTTMLKNDYVEIVILTNSILFLHFFVNYILIAVILYTT